MDDNEETRRMVEHCYAKRKTTINPIVDWTDDEVWEFLNEVAKVPHCELYDEGFTRLGCIGCPLQGRTGMLEDFERWPRYKELYIRAFDKMIQNHHGEIKVASGELAETNGGGSCFASGSGGAHEWTEPGNQPMVEDANGDAGDGELAGSVTSERETRARQCSDGGYGGADYMMYWLWRCRTDQMDWSLHPLRGYDPKAFHYDEDSTQILM